MTSIKDHSEENLDSTREVRGDGFLFISFLLLAIPLFYLSYEFNKANEEEIVFAESENKGLLSLLQQDHWYIKQRNDFIERVPKDCSFNIDEQISGLKLKRETTLDNSNLILDPQMETYHLIVASQKLSYGIEKQVLDLYRIYLKCAGGLLSNNPLYSSFIRSNSSDAIASYKKFCTKDCPPHFKLSYEKYESLLLDVFHSLETNLGSDLRDKVLLKNQIKHFFDSSDSLRLQSNGLIAIKLNERISKFSLRRKSVQVATFILWLASLICSYVFYSINLKKIRNYIVHIQNQNEELERVKKLSLLGELAAGIGHEINNPLSVAAISLELINRKLEMENSGGSHRDDIKTLLVRIDKMISNIKQIIRSFKSFSYSGDDEKISDISLQEAVNDSLLLVQHKSLENNVVIQNLISEDLKIFGTLYGVVQVLVNLLNNGIDAMEYYPHKRWIRIEAVPRDEFVLIEISDCGPGVPPHIREKIFNPLFTTKNSSKGTGLGLGLARKICLKYGGDLLLVDSEEGARFQVKLRLS